MTQIDDRNRLRGAIYSALANLGEKETKKIVDECMGQSSREHYSGQSTSQFDDVPNFRDR